MKKIFYFSSLCFFSLLASCSSEEPMANKSNQAVSENTNNLINGLKSGANSSGTKKDINSRSSLVFEYYSDNTIEEVSERLVNQIEIQLSTYKNDIQRVQDATNLVCHYSVGNGRVNLVGWEFLRDSNGEAQFIQGIQWNQNQSSYVPLSNGMDSIWAWENLPCPPNSLTIAQFGFDHQDPYGAMGNAIGQYMDAHGGFVPGNYTFNVNISLIGGTATCASLSR